MRAECRPIPKLTEKQMDRFFGSIHINTSTGCWEWTGYCHPEDEYGQFSANYEHWWAHRVAYAIFREQPPLDKTLDHTCRNRWCVNPWHLEPLTNRKNILRGESPAARQARQTHCKRGHALEGENLYTYPSGKRCCMECQRVHRTSERARELQRLHYWANIDHERARQRAKYQKSAMQREDQRPA